MTGSRPFFILTVIVLLASSVLANPIDLPARILALKGKYQPYDLSGARTQAVSELKSRLAAMDNFLRSAGQEKRQGWRSFLRVNDLESQVDSPSPSVKTLRSIWNRFRRNNVGLEDHRFVAVQRQIRHWIWLLELGDPATLPAQYDLAIEQLSDAIANYELTDAGSEAAKVGRALGFLALIEQKSTVLDEVKRRYSACNVHLTFSDEFFSMALAPPQEVYEKQFMHELSYSGTSFSGWLTTSGKITPRLRPDDRHLSFSIPFAGHSDAYLSAQIRNSTISTKVTTTLNAQKTILATLDGLTSSKTYADADAEIQLRDVLSPGLWRSRRPLLENLIARTVSKQIGASEAAAEQEAKEKLEDQIDKQVMEQMKKASTALDKMKRTLTFQNTFPAAATFRSSETKGYLSILESSPVQIGAITQPLRPHAEHAITLVVHESAIRNYFDSYMGGKWEKDTNFLQVYKILTGDEPEDLWVHDNAPRWAVKMPESESLSMEFRNNQITIHLAIAEAVKSFKGIDVRVERQMVMSAVYELKLNEDSILMLVRPGPITLRYTDGESMPCTEDERAIHDLLVIKLSAFFSPQVLIDPSFPPGSQLEKFNAIKTREARAEHGWLLLGDDIRKEDD